MGGGCSARLAEQPWILYLAARLCPQALPHDACVLCQQLVGRLHVQARHDVVVGLPVSASNIGYTKPKERSQGKGGDLRSKYDPTLTAAREKYNRDRLPGTLCRAALITTLRLGTAQVLG